MFETRPSPLAQTTLDKIWVPTVVVVIVTVVVVVVIIVVVVVVIVVVVVCEAGGSFASRRARILLDVYGQTWTNYILWFTKLKRSEVIWRFPQGNHHTEVKSSSGCDNWPKWFCRHTSPATGISEVETVSVVSVVSVVTSQKSVMNGARDHVMNMTCCKKKHG